MKRLLDWTERGLFPDPLVRVGIRRLLAVGIAGERRAASEEQLSAFYEFVDRTRDAPIAVAAGDANRQHYEVPAAFFERILGPRLKYSACLWTPGIRSLGEAEDAMLEMSCNRAELRDGMDILELGCGWGSLTLWMAERYRGSRITAVSNSASQREFIEAQCARRGFGNVKVITADMNGFRAEGAFDRVVSVEMFEHMRNWTRLFERIRGWLRPGGGMFMHIFCHREIPYLFKSETPEDWMGYHFFTGGMMPAESLPMAYPRDMWVERHWRVNGRHYSRTLRAWLDRLDAQRAEILALFRGIYGEADARRWVRRWRLFLMGCEELFACRAGTEWYVAHYLLRRRD